jgi:hypothetical protein
MSWFSDFVDSVKEAFSGGSQSDSGNDRTPSRTPPPQRPSIMSVERNGQMQRVATRDMPRFGISEGQSESEPSYSPFSLQGLTSTDPGNVMRNIQGAERQASATPADSGRDDSPAPEMTSVAEQEAAAEEAQARRLRLR